MPYELNAEAEGRLTGFLDMIGEALGNKKRKASFATYAMGLLGEGDRKSVEPIAINAIAELFALPEVDRSRFMRWAKDLLKPAGAAVNTDDVRNSLRQTTHEMIAYLKAIVERPPAV